MQMDGGGGGVGGAGAGGPPREARGGAAEGEAEAMLESVRGLPDDAPLDEGPAMDAVRAAVRAAHARTALAKVTLALADHVAARRS